MARMSEPQIDDARIRSNTCPRPGAGTSTSLKPTVESPGSTTPRIAVPIGEMDRDGCGGVISAAPTVMSWLPEPSAAGPRGRPLRAQLERGAQHRHALIRY